MESKKRWKTRATRRVDDWLGSCSPDGHEYEDTQRRKDSRKARGHKRGGGGTQSPLTVRGDGWGGHSGTLCQTDEEGKLGETSAASQT